MYALNNIIQFELNGQLQAGRVKKVYRNHLLVLFINVHQPSMPKSKIKIHRDTVRRLISE